ncbi:MAG: class I mannose-6-phosphate isomerase [Edaphobacter sp.]|uniref:type I phosphomannose isomerase catalytic subunit n=1 Tax=Edaphobacter sp. TaxID=1934404 RepID=UPI00239D88DE|nr:type I phosphomannose isomerase catalytic subunit [Edaphobacter sp.]MDE1175258.1 class I mannose-6-phosphate isomerase [Edaphobacter sp.]
MATTTKVAPFRLKPWFSERPWGKKSLEPWYSETGTTELVGEAWLTGPQCVVEEGEFEGRTLESLSTDLGGEFPLLVKLLFPNEKLSVQVHPDDAQAKASGGTRGKTECWYVLEAEPGAAVALGLKPGSTPEKITASVADGTMEDLMVWVPVNVGDMLFVDAGTVHAIGPGCVLLETQQTSDITYRLYDYGRPRELHLEQGLKVIRPVTEAGKVEAREMDGFTRLIEQKYFTVDRFDLEKDEERKISFSGPGCVVGLKGKVAVITPGEEIELEPGKAIVIPEGVGEVIIEASEASAFVRCIAPAMG